MDHIQRAVHEVVLRVARQVTPALSGVENGQRLTADLGLKSLDLARIVAVLELELGSDPFASLAAITDMRTVGDLCTAYRKALSASARPTPAVPLTSSLDRAAVRRGAWTGHQDDGKTLSRDGEETPCSPDNPL
jgi:hypothetical protein